MAWDCHSRSRPMARGPTPSGASVASALSTALAASACRAEASRAARADCVRSRVRDLLQGAVQDDAAHAPVDARLRLFERHGTEAQFCECAEPALALQLEEPGAALDAAESRAAAPAPPAPLRVFARRSTASRASAQRRPSPAHRNRQAAAAWPSTSVSFSRCGQDSTSACARARQCAMISRASVTRASGVAPGIASWRWISMGSNGSTATGRGQAVAVNPETQRLSNCTPGSS